MRLVRGIRAYARHDGQITRFGAAHTRPVRRVWSTQELASANGRSWWSSSRSAREPCDDRCRQLRTNSREIVELVMSPDGSKAAGHHTSLDRLQHSLKRPRYQRPSMRWAVTAAHLQQQASQTKNSARFLPSIHFGALPLPLQLAPVSGSRYLAATLLTTGFQGKTCCAVKPNSAIKSWTVSSACFACALRATAIF